MRVSFDENATSRVDAQKGRILRCWWCVSEFSRLIEWRGEPRSDNSGVCRIEMVFGFVANATTTKSV